jgi:hypothetical protein
MSGAILLAWHERQVTRHLERLPELREQAGDAGERHQAVLEAYTLINYEIAAHHHGRLPTPGTPRSRRFCIEVSTSPRRSSASVT